MLRLKTAIVVAVSCVACGHASRTQAMRAALDRGQPASAVAALNSELKVKSADHRPKRLVNDAALLVLDRATIQQSLTDFDRSKRDYEAADKAIDMLDLSHGAADTLARWAFSDSAGRYVAPPHEKLFINTLNLVNYLETRDLDGARVEARRLNVMARYLRDHGLQSPSSLVLGDLLSGFVYEKSGQTEEALRYYADVLRVREVAPTLTAAASSQEEGVPASDDGEILLVLGYGRAPRKIDNRLPIGLALTRASHALAPGDREAASRLAAQGLVTWVNYPSLGDARDAVEVPVCTIDGAPCALEEIVDVAAEVRAAWAKIEGSVMASAISRMVVRLAAGTAIEGIAGASKDKDVGAVGTLLSLLTQAAMTAADTPDTRSWETLPAHIVVFRKRVPPGDHTVTLAARGHQRNHRVHMASHGWSVVSLMALR